MENKDSIESEEKALQNSEKSSAEAAPEKEQEATASESKVSNNETPTKTNTGGRKRTRTRISQTTDRKSCILVSTDEDKRGSASIISRNNDASRAVAQQKESNNDEDWDISLEGMFDKLSREADEVIGRTMQMLEQDEPVRTSSHRPTTSATDVLLKREAERTIDPSILLSDKRSVTTLSLSMKKHNMQVNPPRARKRKRRKFNADRRKLSLILRCQWILRLLYVSISFWLVRAYALAVLPTNSSWMGTSL